MEDAACDCTRVLGEEVVVCAGVHVPVHVPVQVWHSGGGGRERKGLPLTL